MSSVSKYDLRFLSHPLIILISPAAPASTSLLSTTHLPHHKKTNFSLDYCFSSWGRHSVKHLSIFSIWFLGLFSLYDLAAQELDKTPHQTLCWCQLVQTTSIQPCASSASCSHLPFIGIGHTGLDTPVWNFLSVLQSALLSSLCLQ